MADLQVTVTYGSTLNTTEFRTDADPGDAPATSGESERFESFTAKLVSVPKTEIDAVRDS